MRHPCSFQPARPPRWSGDLSLGCPEQISPQAAVHEASPGVSGQGAEQPLHNHQLGVRADCDPVPALGKGGNTRSGRKKDHRLDQTSGRRDGGWRRTHRVSLGDAVFRAGGVRSKNG